MWSESGALCIGAVAALTVADRVLRERPAAVRTRMHFAVWACAFALAVSAAAWTLAGARHVIWLAAGAAVSGLVRMAISVSRRGSAESGQ